MEQKTTQTLWFAQPLSYIADTFKGFFSSISQGVRGTTSHYLNLLGVKTENDLLRKENLELRAQLTASGEVLNELNRLREYMQFSKKSKMKLVPAKIVGRDLIPDHQTVTVNKGSQDGIKELQAVISMTGAIGYVFKTEAYTSHIMLMTDRYSVVDVLIQKNRAHALIEGLGKGLAQLEYVNHDEMPIVGDKLITGGLDNIFPKGFPVAVVSEVQKTAAKTSSLILVKPVIEFDKLEEVFIVTNAAHEDYTDKDLAENVQ